MTRKNPTSPTVKIVSPAKAATAELLDLVHRKQGQLYSAYGRKSKTARAFDRLVIQVEALPELMAALHKLCGALNMSDSEHEYFRDSCADVVEFLWLGDDERKLLKRLEGK